MKKKHIEQIKKMVGTEYIYVFEDGSELPAVVAAFDPKVGFTCLATSLIDSHGDDHNDRVDDNGNFCLTGISLGRNARLIDTNSILFVIRSIRCLGYYKANTAKGFGYISMGGSAHCSF